MAAKSANEKELDKRQRSSFFAKDFFSVVRKLGSPKRSIYYEGVYRAETSEGEKMAMTQKILVIDDDIISQNLLRSTLTQGGYSVIAASDGDEGIKKATQEMPGLIILDIMMPGMDGGEVAGVLKNDPETKKIPIIFLSSLVTESNKKLNNKKDMITYLSKPYNRDELLNEVKRYFSG